jgi:hypothetical protein
LVAAIASATNMTTIRAVMRDFMFAVRCGVWGRYVECC